MVDLRVLCNFKIQLCKYAASLPRELNDVIRKKITWQKKSSSGHTNVPRDTPH